MPCLDWRMLERELSSRHLLTVLGPRIVELGPEVPSDFALAVEAAIRNAHARGGFLLLVGDRVGRALADAGIASMPLKGPVLGQAIYGDPGRRLSSDLDILVPRELVNDAVEVVRGLGYSAPRDALERSGLPALHFGLEHERGELPPVELHWRVHWYESRFARERLLPPDPRETTWRPAPAAELVALLLFYARDGFAGLRLACDVGAWWDAFGEEVQVGSVDAICRDYPALRKAVMTAVGVAGRTVALPAEAILADRGEFRAGQVASRLADPLPTRSPAQVHADIGMVDLLLAPTRELPAVLMRNLLRSTEQVESFARDSGPWTARTPVGYALRLTMRYCSSLSRAIFSVLYRGARGRDPYRTLRRSPC